MAETNNVITKAEYNNNTYNIGATFDNVFVSDNNSWSLQDLYEYLEQFLKSPLFEYYGENAPELDNVNIWYDTSTPASEETNTQAQG